MNHTPKIEPYVTAKGGVVILNGPFPLDQAERVRALCAAAPRMLEMLREIAVNVPKDMDRIIDYAKKKDDASVGIMARETKTIITRRVRALLREIEGEEAKP